MLDLFSGGGAGWCLAARSLGLDSIGIEMDAAACKTRAVVGLRTIRADVSTYPAEVFAGKVDGLCGSPPCQSYSKAGKGKGLADPRGQLVYEPMRYVRAINPRWVALEQVPEVLTYWRWMCRELREMGYSAWCGILDAVSYGVPQIRKRAILLASLDRQVQPPAPTHSKHGADELFGDGLKPWVTMAEGLGWGLTERPAYTVCGDSSGGGHHDGGSGQRAQVAKAQAEGRWAWGVPGMVLDRNQSPKSGVLDRPITNPAPTVTAAAGSKAPWAWKLDRRGVELVTPGRSYSAPPRRADPQSEPSPTIALGHNEASWGWESSATSTRVTISELGILQGFPADHPWQPPRRSAQIGNAIPPPLAEACLRALVG